ncbi:MAG: ribosome biogenesis GTPase YlqF [Clostridiales bacterium]|nr:ribosome biogenesis GTPase YlqF [Clostridiales bacterium]
MAYQWYPGHMTKAKRMMQEDVKLVDLVIELTDARAPQSGRNPDIDELGKNKSRVILLNKADMADERQNACWEAYFRRKGLFAAAVNSRTGAGMKRIQSVIMEACQEKMERDRRRGILNRPVRAMVAGIPNVGKSTFINSFAGKACAKTGNKPGVTRGKQWIRLNKSVELLDTPGILWPKIDDPQVGQRLAALGSIRDGIIQTEDLALWVLDFTRKNYPGFLAVRYSIEEGADTPVLLGEIARVRGCIHTGNEPDYEKAAALVLDDFRSGRIGRMTLEQAPGEDSEKTLGKKMNRGNEHGKGAE